MTSRIEKCAGIIAEQHATRHALAHSRGTPQNGKPMAGWYPTSGILAGHADGVVVRVAMENVENAIYNIFVSSLESQEIV